MNTLLSLTQQAIRCPENKSPRRLSRLFGIALVAAGMATSASAQVVSAVLPVEERLQAALDSVLADDRAAFPGAVVHVIQPGVGSWTVAVGVANSATGEPPAPDARFRAGSNMKSFVATVALQLSEEGKLALDQPVTDLLPPSVTYRFADTDRITVRMLLDHTSGLPEWNTDAVRAAVAADPLRIIPTDELLDLAAAREPTFAPGTGWAYSNTNYNLLGLVIEEVTGNTWRAAVRERVIDRLGLRNTSVPEPGEPSIAGPVMQGYSLFTPEPQDFTVIDPSMAGAAGGSALITTTADLATFFDALRGGALFDNPATFELMSDFIPSPADGFQTGYGLGLQHLVFPGGIEMVGHFGVTAGYFSIFGYFPALDLTVAAAINAWPANPGPLLLAILGEFTGKPTPRMAQGEGRQ